MKFVKDVKDYGSLNSDAVSRIEDLLTKYHTLFRRNAVEWIFTENQNVAVKHFPAAIRP